MFSAITLFIYNNFIPLHSFGIFESQSLNLLKKLKSFKESITIIQKHGTGAFEEDLKVISRKLVFGANEYLIKMCLIQPKSIF